MFRLSKSGAAIYLNWTKYKSFQITAGLKSFNQQIQICTWSLQYVSRLFFVQAFKIVVDSWNFSILLLYILWDDWPIFMISCSNEQLQQHLEYTLLKPDYHSWWISKMQSDTLEERYAIKSCFKLGKNPAGTYRMLLTVLEHLAWIEHQFLSGIRDSRKARNLWGMVRGVGGVRKSIHQSWFRRKMPALFKSGQWHFHQHNTPVHNSILLTDYLTKTDIKTVPQPPYSPDLAPCDFWLFPKLRGCRYETIEEMKETVTKVIDFHGAFQKLLERYNKCIAAGGY